MKTCYMCDCVKSSYEHVPPKCFFPNKGIAGKDLKINLITVPSCDLHNTKKSGDDEYLLLFTLLNYAKNNIGERYFVLDRLSAIQRHKSLKNKVASIISNNPVPIHINNEESIAVNVDMEKIWRSIDHITRAIFYHHYKEKLFSPLTIYPLLALLPDPRSQTYYEKSNSHSQIVNVSHKHFSLLSRYGNNQEIFYYQIDDSSDSFSMRICFYEGVDFLSIFKKQKAS